MKYNFGINTDYTVFRDWNYLIFLKSLLKSNYNFRITFLFHFYFLMTRKVKLVYKFHAYNNAPLKTHCKTYP